MFLLNNTVWHTKSCDNVRQCQLTVSKFIQGLHVLTGAKYLNTMTAADSITCPTVTFSVVMFLICWICSLPRTFDALAKLGAVSAAFTFISVLLAVIFAGIQDHPAGYTPELGAPEVLAIPAASTTFVSGLSAFLNISYTFIGQITLPSFIAEMKEPRYVRLMSHRPHPANILGLCRDFPKALWLCTIGEIIVFSLVGAIVYAFVGTQYMTAPAFGSLEPLYKKVAFSFMIPTLIFLGVLYASVSARLVFFRLFKDSKHKSEHTIVGWASWAGILLLTWIGAFIISQIIPFFSDRKSQTQPTRLGVTPTNLVASTDNFSYISPIPHVLSLRQLLRIHLLGRSILPHAKRRRRCRIYEVPGLLGLRRSCIERTNHTDGPVLPRTRNIRQREEHFARL